MNTKLVLSVYLWVNLSNRIDLNEECMVIYIQKATLVYMHVSIGGQGTFGLKHRHDYNKPTTSMGGDPGGSRRQDPHL